ncbi:hypothetical protein [Mycolicibacterium austroafricanum]|uniref:hypothetical protein n=1 Tax=Mycolicibacterium austroafricanum TaxID=39687 RepID=UPI00068814F3|nr:hypothetical protein [Mycolicibacterium austroafricanum]
MTINSLVQRRGTVDLPEYTGERRYMVPFFQRDGLPVGLERWRETVEEMLDGLVTDREVYLMIDQSYVDAAATQRRPGAHVDGWWQPALRRHDHGGHRLAPGAHVVDPRPPGHRTTPWNPAHRAAPQRPGGGHGLVRSIVPTHSGELVESDQLILLASDVTASRGWAGEAAGEPADGGDCAHIDVTGLDQVVFTAGHCWAGNARMLHESTPLAAGGLRTLVRLNVPVDDAAAVLAP